LNFVNLDGEYTKELRADAWEMADRFADEMTKIKPSSCFNLDGGAFRDAAAREQEEVVGTKPFAAIEADFLKQYEQTKPQGRPEGGLTIEEMAKAANVSHGTIRRWLSTQSGYKTILGTKQYASRKQVVTYYVKQ
jgi:hypothetical protein